MSLKKRVSDGALLKFGSGPNVGKLMKECCCECDPLDPGLANCYEINGYFNGMITACSGPGFCTIEPIWDGSWERLPGQCIWLVDILGNNKCMDGDILNAFNGGLRWNDPQYPNLWWLAIVTSNGCSWQGIKSPSPSPVGTYTRDFTSGFVFCGTGGSVLPATLDIVAC